MAGAPNGLRLRDHISLGMITRTFSIEEGRRALAETGKASERERDLLHVVGYDAIALALSMTASTREGLRCLLEGRRWLWGAEAEAVRVAGKSSLSQARTRLGEAPLRRLCGAGGVADRDAAPPRGRGGWSAWTWSTRRRTALPSVGRKSAVSASGGVG